MVTPFARALLPSALSFFLSAPAPAQDGAPPALRAGALNGSLHIDGVLDEGEWNQAEAVDAFTQTDPVEGVFWRRRPDLNRGWRFCRQGRDVYLVDSSCFLVGPAPSFSLVFGRYCSQVVPRSVDCDRVIPTP